MIQDVIAAIDKEMAALQQARNILTGVAQPSSADAPRRGRPKGSKNSVKSAPVKAKRVLSEEGRARISAAMKKRHAAKKRAAKKAAAEQSA